MHKIFVFLTLSFSILSKPGKEALLDSREIVGQAFIKEVVSKGENDFSIHVLWVPENLVDQCLNKSFDDCYLSTREFARKTGQARGHYLWQDSGQSSVWKKFVDKKNAKSFSLEKINKDFSLIAKVKWEKWSNGSNITVLNFTQEE